MRQQPDPTLSAHRTRASIRPDAPLDVGPFAHGGLVPIGPNGLTPLEVPNTPSHPSITVHLTPSPLTTTNGAPDDPPAPAPAAQRTRNR